LKKEKLDQQLKKEENDLFNFRVTAKAAALELNSYSTQK